MGTIGQDRDPVLANALAPILRAKLDDMTQHDDTGDPYDEGYMRAVSELREWIGGSDAP